MPRLEANRDLISAIEDMSDMELDVALKQLLDEKKDRAMQAGDPDVIVREAMQQLFTGSGIEPPKIMAPGIVGLANVHTETSADKHECNMYTVVHPDGAAEYWSWDDTCETYLHSDRAKVGKIFRSISLHNTIPGLIFVRHNRKHNGQRHVPLSVIAFQVKVEYDTETGEITSEKIERLMDWTPSHLPPPIGMEDENSYANGGAGSSDHMTGKR